MPVQYCLHSASEAYTFTRSKSGQSDWLCLVTWPHRERETVNLLCKGKYRCTADLLFYRLGFNRKSKSIIVNFNASFWTQNQSNRRSAVHLFFPLQSKQECANRMGQILGEWIQCNASLNIYLGRPHDTGLQPYWDPGHNFQWKLVELSANIQKRLF